MIELKERSMPKLEIIGFAPSTYVRVVRMACEEKGVDYELKPAPPHFARRAGDSSLRQDSGDASR
jgi:glutathione S-transferase